MLRCTTLFTLVNLLVNGSGSGSRTQPSPGYEPSMQPMHRPAILKNRKTIRARPKVLNKSFLQGLTCERGSPSGELKSFLHSSFSCQSSICCHLQVALFRATHTVYHIRPASVKGVWKSFSFYFPINFDFNPMINLCLYSFDSFWNFAHRILQTHFHSVLERFFWRRMSCSTIFLSK